MTIGVGMAKSVCVSHTGMAFHALKGPGYAFDGPMRYYDLTGSDEESGSVCPAGQNIQKLTQGDAKCSDEGNRPCRCIPADPADEGKNCAADPILGDHVCQEICPHKCVTRKKNEKNICEWDRYQLNNEDDKIGQYLCGGVDDPPENEIRKSCRCSSKKDGEKMKAGSSCGRSPDGNEPLECERFCRVHCFVSTDGTGCDFKPEGGNKRVLHPVRSQGEGDERCQHRKFGEGAGY